MNGARKIILPGVGAFDRAMHLLNQSRMRERLDDLVQDQQGVDVLGICVGMQMMARRSDEGVLPGLAWIDAEVHSPQKALGDKQAQLPHMGWNDVVPVKSEQGLFKGFGADARFYFLHSYFFFPRHDEDVLAVTDYHGKFASSVGHGRVFGVQFHPEKSHHWGVRLLKNFAEL